MRAKPRRRLLDAGAPGLSEAGQRLTASPLIGVLRAANAAGAPYLGGRYAPRGRDQAAVIAPG